MNWNSAAEFFAMGGHALYVWGSFGACLVAMVLEPVLIGHRRKSILANLRRRVRADALHPENP